MEPHYDFPALAQYVFDRQLAEYQYRTSRHTPSIQIVREDKPSLRPLEDATLLEEQVFRSYLDTNAAYWNFISDQSAVEKSQLQILLGQLSARHGLTAKIHENLDYRETLVSSQLSAAQNGAMGYRDPLGLKMRLESRLEEIDRERSMESVGLWRDSQKLLGDLFRHWTAYANLTRRSRVIDGEL